MATAYIISLQSCALVSLKISLDSSGRSPAQAKGIGKNARAKANNVLLISGRSIANVQKKHTHQQIQPHPSLDLAYMTPPTSAPIREEAAAHKPTSFHVKILTENKVHHSKFVDLVCTRV
jgi:hypothetical protein